ncbi:sulfatase [Opitutaceae bacterium EW11]|nr:sulfatase [Opitutaceae bacterium EW11]
MNGRRPNILWLVTTQWRAQACGYAGNADVRTPALDALASRALVFDDAVTPHPFGPFARAAMLTGVESPKNGVRDYFDPLPESSRTVAHDLNERGYSTAFFGKWHLARRDPSAPLVGELHARVIVPPESHGGFSFWEGFESGFLLNDPWLHGTRLPEPSQFPGYQSDVLCARAGQWCSEQGGGPWFCVVSLEPPHPPYAANPNGAGDPDAVSLAPNVPLGGAVERQARSELAGYYGHIAATDHAIGALLEKLDLTTTAVLVTSVHGDMHGSHGRFRKGWPYEESIRVPLLVSVPGSPAERSRVAVSLTNLREWTVSLADAGRLPQITADAARISMPSVVRLPHQCDRLWCGVRSKARKLVLNEDGSPWLFFHLDRDPFELTNLADSRDVQGEIAEWVRRLAVAEL